ncbi:hypothetical protein J5N97_008196 [Dioscorea zingiberensis]|uniref:GTD-binding domain-containing protein n=1 Tax=Dioscorea zingiberensis TaxID=325984 RepID=A0A9D5DDP0_9LILI|nr:hypothetical protein J5N97_008196 [Dioscorea zingiberensis]
MDEGDQIRVLKEALCKQCLLMRKLYIELEEEREASATAANETLSMILRLQVEKAEEKMEACQYKKLTEEKMRQNEESLAILEEIIHQKEMEITFLKHQVQFLKQRLLSVGVNDVGDLDMYVPSTLNLDRFSNETDFHGSFTRNISLPSVRLEKIFSEMDIVGKDRSSLHKGQPIYRAISDCTNQLTENSKEHQWQCLDNKSLLKECTCRKVDLSVGVKELLHTGRAEGTSNFESTSAKDAFRCSCLLFGETRTNFNIKCVSSLPFQAENHELTESGMLGHSCLDAELNRNRSQMVSVQDICGVPESHNGPVHCESFKKLLHEAVLEAKDKTVVPISLSREAIDYYLKGNDLLNRAFICMDHGCKTRKITSMNCPCDPVHPKIEIAPCKTDTEQLKQLLLQLEDDGRTPKRDAFKRDNEQVKFLKEIYEQLSMIQLCIKNFIFRKKPPQDDSLFISLMEAMLYFSI